MPLEDLHQPWTVSSHEHAAIYDTVKDQIMYHIERSAEFRELTQFAGKLDNMSVEGFLKSIRGSLQIQIEHSQVGKGVGRVRITSRKRYLRNSLLNSLSERVISQTRRRNDRSNARLEFLGVLLDSGEDVVGIITINWPMQGYVGTHMNPQSTVRHQQDFLTDIISKNAETIAMEVLAQTEGGYLE